MKKVRWWIAFLSQKHPMKPERFFALEYRFGGASWNERWYFVLEARAHKP